MSTFRTARALLAAAVLLLPATGCGHGQDARTDSATDLPTGDGAVTLDPSEFTPGSDNPWFPLVPRTRWTYAEHDADGTTLQVVVTVTDETREVANGVEARVVRDTVLEDGAVVEDTFDWYAQDADGSVWYLGEQTAEFEDGELATREGSFEAGVDGAQPGVIMPAEPQPGQSYRQEYLQDEAEDAGAVLATGQQVSTEAGHWDDALLTADSTPLEPDVLEYKLYARDVGLVLTVDVSGGAGREELTGTSRVSAAQAASAGTTPLGQPYLG